MEIIALLSSSDEIITSVKNILSGYTVYPAKNFAELEELILSIPATLLILDSAGVKTSQIEEMQQLDYCPVLLLLNEGFDLYKLMHPPVSVGVADIFKSLKTSVDGIIEKKRLEQRIKTLNGTQQKQELTPPKIVDYPAKWSLHEQVLTNLAKTLTVQFDLNKLLDHFMDSIMEITRVNKMSILLREKNIFQIRAQIGIDPYIAENIKLTNESSLIKWLAVHGRILSRSLNIKYHLYPDLHKEMELLQCIFSFPMIYKGKIIGVFNIDNKITGDPFYKEELEIIFILCNYLSAAIKDIDSYHQIQHQKEFTKNILSNMNSGVISINSDNRISVFNQRASEILKLNALDILGSDLRRLPSPLGDILHETMKEGTSYSRHEIVIKPGNIPLGINSYQIIDENRKPQGAVIVFTDLSDLKRLDKERKKAENLETINNLISKIAHEIKNPLTSIQTFTQLLETKYEDEEFRRFFSLTVLQSIKQLNNLIDKLVLFSSPLDYRPEVLNINAIIDEVVNYVWKDMPAGVRLMKEGLDRNVYVKVDRRLFVKALYFLILTSADRAPKDDFVLLQVSEDRNDPEHIKITVKFSGTLLAEDEKELLLRPLLDIDAFGIELNVPLSQKIIEKHNGTLTITHDENYNALTILLPTIEKSDISIKEDNYHGQ